MSGEPRITFLMSTYNAGEFLRPALDSVLAQSRPDWRLIVVDDCSKDGSAGVVASYGDPRIRLEALERNVGQTGALNHGLGLVETEWVARLDQDDIAVPERIEEQLGYVDAHPGTVGVGSFADYVDEQGSVIATFRPPTAPEAVLRRLYSNLERNPFVHSAMTFRADAARAVGGYPPTLSFAQDLALWLRLAAHGELANVPKVLTYVRVHPGQTSGPRHIALRQLEESLEATEEAPRDLDLTRSQQAAWRRGRARIRTHLAIAAVAAGDRRAALRGAGQLLREGTAHPSTLLGVAGVVAEGVGHRVRARRAPGA